MLEQCQQISDQVQHGRRKLNMEVAYRQKQSSQRDANIIVSSKIWITITTVVEEEM